MRSIKITVLAFLLMGVTQALAQDKKEAKKEETHKVVSNGNAEAMRRNLNYPNATNPADHNIQKYDKGDGRIQTEHPKENLGNSYTRKAIEKENKK